MNYDMEKLRSMSRVELEGTLESVSLVNNDCDEYLDWIKRFASLKQLEMVRDYLKKIACDLGKEEKI